MLERSTHTREENERNNKTEHKSRGIRLQSETERRE